MGRLNDSGETPSRKNNVALAVCVLHQKSRAIELQRR